MTRRAFSRSMAYASPVVLLPKKSEAFGVLPVLVGGGALVMAYMLWRIYKLAHDKLAPPPACPTDGATNAPPTMPPKTNAPPTMPPKRTAMLEGGDITVDDVSSFGLILPDLSQIIYYCKVEFQSSPNLLARWNHEVTIEVWAGLTSAVMKTDSDTQWCPNRQDIWLDFGSTDQQSYYRMKQDTTSL